MTLTITDKMLDARHVGASDKTELLVFEGTIRSSKTVTAIEIFMDHLHESPHELHVMGAASLSSIRDTLLDNELGILKLYKECRLKKDNIGDFYVSVRSHRIVNGRPVKMMKKILLAGYTNADRWKCILGKTIDTILIDEVNIASLIFINECFMRQTSVDRPLTIWTLNGDNPQHDIYTQFINQCKIIGVAPASIRADMDRVAKHKGWYYMHWLMSDNPVMTPEKIARASAVFPVGSYYYTIKVLGERGVPGKLIYIDYLNESLRADLPPGMIVKYTIGADIGESKAENVFALVGWNANYSKCRVIRLDCFKGLGYKQKQDRLEAFLRDCLEKRLYIECVSIDSAEGNFIKDMQTYITGLLGVSVIPSYKATIKERIDMNIVAMSTKRLTFCPEADDAFNAFKVAKWAKGKEGQEREDLNEPHNDKLDAIEYAQTVHMSAFMRAKEIEVIDDEDY
jgi:hypothetical protein